MDATVARCVVNTSNSLIVAARIRCRRPIVGGFQLSAFCPSLAIRGSGSGIRLCRRCGSSRLPFCASSVSSTPPRSPLSSEPAGGSIGGCDEKVLGGGALRSLGPGAMSFTAVLLGWLGAENKHLKRYAEMYKSRGMRVTSLVIGPGELLRVDLGKMVEQRIAGFARDLVSLVTEEGKYGKESCLLFHTFSNTGWLAYGAILDNLQSREDIISKIKGCIVDSGGDPNINPKVWAAGFCAALLKRNSNSLTYPWGDSTKEETIHNSNKSSTKQDGQYYLADMFFLTVLETFFTFLLKLPDVKKRLERIITVLIEKQPLSPQLYLYSSADKVIPFQSVELFIEEQKAIGRNVYAYNFLFSPHVDHLRTFSDVYHSQVHRFLDECLLGINSNSTP